MMRALGRWIGRLLIVLLAAIALLFVFGPREDVDLDTRFNTARISPDPETYLADAETRIGDVLPHAAKRIQWAGASGEKTALAVIYLHGFSASAEEIRPVPDRVAQALAANLYFARYTGHGRSDPDAMADGSVNAWLRDTAEALAIARAIGHETLILSTSTGGTLAALALTQPDLSDGVKGVVFISPNFGIKNPMAPLLTMPAARQILPPLLGKRRSWAPRKPGQGQFWTTDYPSVAVLPVAAAVRAAQQADFGAVQVPALFYYSASDNVVDAAETQRIIPTWGAAVSERVVIPSPQGDPDQHVITGDIMSADTTDHTVSSILDWIKGL